MDLRGEFGERSVQKFRRVAVRNPDRKALFQREDEFHIIHRVEFAVDEQRDRVFRIAHHGIPAPRDFGGRVADRHRDDRLFQARPVTAEERLGKERPPCVFLFKNLLYIRIFSGTGKVSQFSYTI